MHFSIPCVPLLANTLIITSFKNVHSQELLVMDSTWSSISYQGMAGEDDFVNKKHVMWRIYRAGRKAQSTET